MSERDQTHLATPRLDYLDSIRGLAALFVLLGHTLGAFAWPAAYTVMTTWPFVTILFNGKEAVAMFFVLSGYVLSKPYVSPSKGGQRTLFLPTFYLRRFIRIWFPWFFAFAVSLAVKAWFFSVPDTAPPTTSWFHWFWVNYPMTAWEFLRQCLFLEHDGGRQLLNQDWSLGVELKGSILIPLFVWFCRPGRIGLMAVVALGLLLLANNGHYYISFIVGVMVARWDWMAFRGWIRDQAGFRWGLFIAGLILYQVYGFSRHWPKFPWMAGDIGWVISACGCGCILLATFASPVWQRGLNSRAVVFLGRISYSVYLLQFIIILAVLPHWLRWLNGLGLPQFACFSLVVLGGVAATLLASTFMYYFVESPVIAFGHWLTRRVEGKLAPARKEHVMAAGKAG